MQNLTVWLTIITFLTTLGLILWRPKGMNESIPASIGAIIVVLIGSVSIFRSRYHFRHHKWCRHYDYGNDCHGDCFGKLGFFNWMAEKLAERAKG